MGGNKNKNNKKKQAQKKEQQAKQEEEVKEVPAQTEEAPQKEEENLTPLQKAQNYRADQQSQLDNFLRDFKDEEANLTAEIDVSGK